MRSIGAMVQVHCNPKYLSSSDISNNSRPTRTLKSNQITAYNSSQTDISHSRRSLLFNTTLSIASLHCYPSTASTPRIVLPAGPEIPPAPRDFFIQAVSLISSQIDENFTVRLAIYETTPNLPSGIPGNPAMDYSKAKDKSTKGSRCGTFHPITATNPIPYDICPIDPYTFDDVINIERPVSAGSPLLVRDCCRHYAYAVPYSRYGFAVEDRVTTIVVSQRTFDHLPEQRWKAILVHELGHAIDFHLFGSRYRLQNQKNNAMKRGGQTREELIGIDQRIKDPEERADLLGELLVLRPKNEYKLCYDPVFALQTLVNPSTECGDNMALMRHYRHEPLQGREIRV